MSAIEPVRVAEELRDAEERRAPVPLLTTRWPDLTWDDAREVARARDRLRLDAGDRHLGYKLGWTSAEMRAALGIDRPNWGSLWRSQVVSGGVIDLATLLHPKVEPELVYRCGADVPADATAEDIAAVGEWAVGIEVVDPRFPSFDFDWLDNTADNSSCARVAIGEFGRPPATPSEVDVDFDDGTEVRRGVGRSAMGDPCAAVAWLASSLAGEELQLRAGDLVFTGGLTAPFDLRAGARYRASSAVLGEVAFTVVDDSPR